MNKFMVTQLYPLTLLIANFDEKMLIPKRYQISYEMETFGVENQAEANRVHNFSCSAVETFIKGINNSIVVSIDHVDYADMIQSDYFGNNIMVLPLTADSTLIAALHRKLNAITNDCSYFRMVKIKDVDTDIGYSLYIDDCEDDIEILPEQKHWLGDYPCWDVSWWDRKDMSSYDNYMISKRKQTIWRKKKDKFNIDKLLQDPLIKLQEALDANEDTVKDGALIEVNFKDKKSWKPRLV